MRVLNIIDTVKIGNNTLISVNNLYEDIRNGSSLEDDKGIQHTILSIGTSNNINITNILLEGDINSKQMFV